MTFNIFHMEQSKPKEEEPSCASFPDYLDLKFDTAHWQIMQRGNVTFYLYSAFLDVRRANGQPSIRCSKSGEQH